MISLFGNSISYIQNKPHDALFYGRGEKNFLARRQIRHQNNL
jgi:hypothetical protein